MPKWLEVRGKGGGGGGLVFCSVLRDVAKKNPHTKKCNIAFPKSIDVYNYHSKGNYGNGGHCNKK